MGSRALFGILAVGAALIVAPAEACAQWSDLGLSGHEVTRLRLRHGLLYACTNDGLHRKVSDTADSSWVLLGFGGQRVHDVLAVSPETLIVARQVTGTGADTVALFRSTDGGMTWNPFQNGLGAGGISWARKVVALLEPTGAPGTPLAAAWAGMNRSTDGGLTWKQVSGAGRFFFLVSGSSTLFAGGEATSLTPFVRRSTDGGETWMTSFFSGNDGRAYDMTFDPSDPNVAFLGTSLGLRRTSDNGVSWTPVPLPLGVGSFALGARAYAPLRLYADGNAQAGGATFFKSDDGGASWTPVSFPASGSDAEWTILVRSGPAADTLFLGMGSGVLRYVELELVAVDPPLWRPQLELRVHPNPSAIATVITFSLPRPLQVSLRVLDSAGRGVATLPAGRYDAGPHRLAWNHPHLPSGIYFCQLRAGNAVASREVLIVRSATR